MSLFQYFKNIPADEEEAANMKKAECYKWLDANLRYCLDNATSFYREKEKTKTYYFSDGWFNRCSKITKMETGTVNEYLHDNGVNANFVREIEENQEDLSYNEFYILTVHLPE